MGTPREESIDEGGRLEREALNPWCFPRRMKELQKVIARGAIREGSTKETPCGGVIRTEASKAA